MDPSDYHTKLSKSDRERQISYITGMWNLIKNDTNEPIYKRETDRYQKQTYGYQRRNVVVGGINQGFRLTYTYTTIYTVWINTYIHYYIYSR